MKTNYVLALSGNDIFSGGGLSADLATYTVNDLHGFVAVTCLTALTDKGFEVIEVSDETFKKQLDSLKDVAFSGIKIGLLPTPAVAKQTLEFIKTHRDIPIVLDPVLVCKEKHDVSVTTLSQELIQFFPYVSLITPNLVEAELLTSHSIESLDDMILAAKELCTLGAKNVVVKGGNRFDKTKAIDIFYDGNTVEILEKPISDKNNIGAGCTFASSIISRLVKGDSVFQAVVNAKEFVYQAIQHSNEYGVVQNYGQK